MYKAVNEIVPAGRLNGVRVEHVTAPNRTYTQLHIDGVVEMSDFPDEQDTNREFCEKAHGDVLIAGLGIGLILTAILDKPDVASVTVVEVNPSVIQLVAPYHQHPKLDVIKGDIFEWEPGEDRKFDVIWNDTSIATLDRLETIRERQTAWLKPDGWLERWYGRPTH